MNCYGVGGTKMQQQGVEIHTNVSELSVVGLVEVLKHYAQVPAVLCYPDELNQVWNNLIHNALQAMNNNGILEISIGTATAKDWDNKININSNVESPPPQPELSS